MEGGTLHRQLKLNSNKVVVVSTERIRSNGITDPGQFLRTDRTLGRRAGARQDRPTAA